MGQSDNTRVNTVAVNAAASVPLCGQAGDREGLIIWNDSATATLYLRFGLVAASSTDWSIKLTPGQYYEAPSMATVAEAVQGRWSVADAAGVARVTEFV